MDRDEGQGGNALLALFKNELIADVVVSYLNLEDMKALSEVSIACSQTVRNSKYFKNTAMLLLSKDTVSEAFLKNTQIPWKALSVDIFQLPWAEKETFHPLLANVSTLQLWTSNMGYDPDDMDMTWTRVVYFLVSNTPKLQALRLRTFMAEDPDFVGPYPEDCLPLSQMPLGLETLELTQDWTEDGSSIKFISSIVAMNQNTLVDLSINSYHYFQGLENIRCPNLKRLKINARPAYAPQALVTFLENLPLLEELVLKLKGEIPAAVLALIRARSSKLKKLHLSFKTITDQPDDADAVDWTFLQGLEALKDVFISRPKCLWGMKAESFGRGAKFLSLLPHQVTKIGFRGLDSFWLSPDYPIDHRLSCAERTGLLAPFSNVTELSLMRCQNTMSNQVMQYILKEFSRLRVLEISHCDDLTGYGLTGVSNSGLGGGTGISLQNLKGLTRFKITNCKWVSRVGLRNAVELPFLQHFYYQGEAPVDKAFVLAIARQNPCLESISVVLSPDENVEELEKRVRRVNRRTRKLKRLFPCPAEDSDSDADHIVVESESDESDDEGICPYAAEGGCGCDGDYCCHCGERHPLGDYFSPDEESDLEEGSDSDDEDDVGYGERVVVVVEENGVNGEENNAKDDKFDPVEENGVNGKVSDVNGNKRVAVEGNAVNGQENDVHGNNRVAVEENGVNGQENDTNGNKRVAVEENDVKGNNLAVVEESDLEDEEDVVMDEERTVVEESDAKSEGSDAEVVKRVIIDEEGDAIDENRVLVEESDEED